MISTSTEWANTLGCVQRTDRENFVPPSDIKIEYRILDDEAQGSAVVSSNGVAPIIYPSSLQEILTEHSYSPIATLEHNEWILGESLSTSSTERTGFVSSAICGADGIFLTHPILTLSWNSPQTERMPGLTLKFSNSLNECARHFVVSAYNGSQKTSSVEITNNNSPSLQIDIDLFNYTRIEVEIIEWSVPYRRARIEYLLIGQVIVFTKADLCDMEHSMSGDLLSFDLPDHYIRFDIDNIDETDDKKRRFNPDDPSGKYKYLAERQEIEVSYIFHLESGDEEHKVGTYYLSEWLIPQNGITATFTARSLIEFMNNVFVPSGTAYSLKSLATAAFTQAEIDSSKWNVSGLSEDTFTLPDDFEYTCAEVIQLIANRSQKVINIDENGVISFITLSVDTENYYIDQFVSYENSEYEISHELMAVDVNDGMATSQNSSVGEIQTLSNPLILDATTALDVATWVKNIMNKRRTISGEFRADPRLQVYDLITNKNQYAINTFYVDSIQYTYGGCFHGKYNGRVIATVNGALYDGYWYSGQESTHDEVYSNEFWEG